MFDHKNKLVALCVIVMFPLAFLSPQPTGANFTLSAETDDYGQYIECEIFRNDTGSWVAYYDPFSLYFQSHQFAWFSNSSIKLECSSYFNSTQVNASDTADGQLYQRHIVNVTNAGAEVFSQANFTYESVNTALDPIWIYVYSVVLNFQPVAGANYQVVVTYDIYMQ